MTAARRGSTESATGRSRVYPSPEKQPRPARTLHPGRSRPPIERNPRPSSLSPSLSRSSCTAVATPAFPAIVQPGRDNAGALPAHAPPTRIARGVFLPSGSLTRAAFRRAWHLARRLLTLVTGERCAMPEACGTRAGLRHGGNPRKGFVETCCARLPYAAHRLLTGPVVLVPDTVNIAAGVCGTAPLPRRLPGQDSA